MIAFEVEEEVAAIASAGGVSMIWERRRGSQRGDSDEGEGRGSVLGNFGTKFYRLRLRN